MTEIFKTDKSQMEVVKHVRKSVLKETPASVKGQIPGKIVQSVGVKSRGTKGEMQATIEKLTSQLDQTNSQLDQLSHTISHELQEPLRKIITFSRILQQKEKELKPAEVKAYYKKIDRSSDRLRKLLEELLNFTRVTNYEKLIVITDLNKIVKSTLFDFELLISEKKAKIIVHKLPEIEAVPFQMSQLFYDIIHNALKFSKTGVAPVVVISSCKLTNKARKLHANLNDNLAYYEITFKDNGIGFDQKYADQIFTMFQRLSNVGEFAGTGIGLSICKKIVQTHYGEIFAEGLEDKGVIIHVILPVEQPVNVPVDLPTVLKTWV